MATIKAIERASVHQIQSGQVIVDLTSVVKELVENSLDAGASAIDVRFKNQGLDSIEIQDNGNGIGPEDFEAVALKHYTSKIKEFEDLDNLDTFGFRGEALSSLSALSHLRIITARAEDGVVGSRLEFEVSGKLKSTTVCSAQKGTTVIAESIFHNLPVRKKALEKNIQREYTKALRFLEACACIAVQIKFSVSNQPAKGSRKVAFATHSNENVKDNIINVFGAKTMAALIKLDLDLTSESHKILASAEANDLGIVPPDHLSKVHVVGFVSRPNWGEGRQAQDRQMLFVNHRPCLLPQVTKAFNEVYKSYNHAQHPFILANFIMDTTAYDVNVSPDKRTIMLHDQTAILEQLKLALTKLFDQIEHTVPSSQLGVQKLPSYKPLTEPVAGWTRDLTGNEAARGRTSDRDAQNVPAHNLIESWAGRNSTARRSRSPEQRDLQQPQNVLDASPETEIVPERMQPFTAQNVANKSTVYGDRTEAMKNGPVTLAQPSQSSSHAFGTPLEDIITQASFQHNQRNGTASRPTSSHQKRSAADRPPTTLSRQAAADEPEIRSTFNNRPAVARGPIDEAFARMRPRRASSESADITIGTHTVRTVVGEADPNKKRRIHKPTLHDSAIDLSSSPLTGRSLLDFAAPGSALEQAVPDQTLQHADTEEGLFCDHSDGEEVVAAYDGTPELSPLDHEELHSPQVRENSMLLDEGDEAVTVDQVDDEATEKAQEEERVARLIHEAERTVLPRSSNAVRRTLARDISKEQEVPLNYKCAIHMSTDAVVQSAIVASQRSMQPDTAMPNLPPADESLDAEVKLSLTVSKSDFEHMRIVGQFNLGFILAVRPRTADAGGQDELFIIDQHAADEKFNYEKYRNALVMQSQRLVQPKVLELSAVEQEVILNHSVALRANGFNIEMVEEDNEHAMRTFQLTSLPMSANRTFTLSDLEELLHLLSELPSGSSEIPRPRKVQQMLAMRACRSSIMVGKTLTGKQMQKVVRNMGEMEKPWNCPHGRPTMRHLSSLGTRKSWLEGQPVGDDMTGALTRGETDWKRWLDQST